MNLQYQRSLLLVPITIAAFILLSGFMGKVGSVTSALTTPNSPRHRHAPNQHQQAAARGEITDATAFGAFCQSRSSFLASCGAALLSAAVVPPQPAQAKEKKVDPALKGTKKDPVFEACLSECMYECTKPKGAEQKSRAECLPECKKSCAKTKEQLMLGTPKEL